MADPAVDNAADSREQAVNAPPRRDGLGVRVLVAALFLPSLYVITLRGDLHFLFVVDLVIGMGLWEFYRLLELKGFRPAKIVGVVFGLALSWYAYFRTGIYANFLLAVALVVLMTYALARRSVQQAVVQISTTIFGVLYVGWLGSHLVLLRELPRVAGLDYALGARFVFLAILLTWGCDTGAYLVGRSLGRHPLFPKVSPNKSQEGAVGGLVFALVAAVIAQRTFAPFLSLSGAMGLGALAAVAGQTGDLVESMMKRDLEVKDSASLLPGHGGVLDRFDSLFFSAPLIYYTLKFFVI